MADFEEELSNEEKLKIAQHYLLSSPPGQFHEVLGDVKKIVSEEVLPENVIAGIARVSNLRQNRLVTAPSGNRVVIAQAGEIDLTHYYDPVNNETFELDHMTLQTHASDVPSNQEESLFAIQRSLQARLLQYVKTAFPGDNAAVSVYSSNGNFVIAITGERTNLKNFWSGKWASTWNLSAHDENATLSGETKIHVHYFEDGNLQMQSVKKVPQVSFLFNNDQVLVDKVAATIQAQESGLQSGLEEMYTNMNNETFRSMRRVMPITRTKMDWNVNAVRMVRQVRK